MRDTMPHKKPGIAIVIAVKPSKKDTKKKYAGDAMPNAMNKAWGFMKAQVIPPNTPECPECGKPLTEGRKYNPPDDKGSPCCGWE